MNSVAQHFTMPPGLSTAIDEWIAAQYAAREPTQAEPLSRPEAIRRLLSLALSLHNKP
jgi:hypothetical protein